MNNSNDAANSVTVKLPRWLWGGDPTGFFRQAGLVARRDNGSELWRIRTSESYRGVSPDLVNADEIVNPSTGQQRFDRLTQIAQDDSLQVNVGLNNPRIAEGYAALRRRTEAQPDLLNSTHLWQAETTLVEAANLGSYCESVHNQLKKFPIVDNPPVHPFDKSGVTAIRRSSSIGYRSKLISVLLRTAHDDKLSSGDLTDAKKQHETVRGSIFGSSENLRSGLAFLDAYIGPLLGALTPAVWAFSAPRSFGSVVFTFGQPGPGTLPGPAELLQVLPSQGAYKRTWSVEGVDGFACFEAVGWWSRRLNDLFGVLTDPVVFADSSGIYNPVRHLHALLTVEQLFQRVSSIATSFRDVHAQRVLLFTVLDTVERLTGRPIEQLCLLEQAEKVLLAVTEKVLPPATGVLLPLASRAVEALRDLQSGFFLADRQLEQPTVGGLSLSRASAEYVKVLRNATHGHGSNKPKKSQQVDLLLTHHSGEVSHDLAYLGYLYLLEVLIRPQALRAYLTASSKR